MLVHAVYFWLKPELTPNQLAEFRRGLESLAEIASVEQAYIGTPAPVPPRPVIDTTYSFSLVILNRDVADQVSYQTDPIHVRFVENFRTYWDRVQIYDSM